MAISLLDQAMANGEILLAQKDEVKTLTLCHIEPSSSSQQAAGIKKTCIGIFSIAHHAAVVVINSQWAIVAHVGCISVSKDEEIANAKAMIRRIDRAMDACHIVKTDDSLRVFLIHQREPSVNNAGASTTQSAYPNTFNELQTGLAAIGVNLSKVTVHTFAVAETIQTGNHQVLIRRELLPPASVFLEDRKIHP